MWREFGNVITCSHSKPILEVTIRAELYERYYKLDPFIPKEVWRYRLYNVAVFADFAAIFQEILYAPVFRGGCTAYGFSISRTFRALAKHFI